MLEGIGPVTVRKLLDEYGSAAAVFAQSPRSLDLFPDIGGTEPGRRRRAGAPGSRLLDWESQVDLKGELRLIRASGVTILTLTDPDYPSFLREIHDPPLVLYVRGDAGCLQRRCLSVVGSRRTTEYGRSTASHIAASLAGMGIGVVSGGARGIDTAAHWGALNAGGATVAVLGHGFSQVYPSENRGLFEKIAESGALVTQFPFRRRGDRQTFPIRNRIVAGMTMGTVVIEANRWSGAMITARMAIEAGRQVFAVPGAFGDEHSSGSNQLIRDGAILIDSMEPIQEELASLFPVPMAGQCFSPGSGVTKMNPEGEGDGAGGVSLPTDMPEADLQVAGLLRKEGGDMTLDDLIYRSGLPVPVVQTALTRLQMRGLVEGRGGGCFRFVTGPPGSA